MSRSIGKPSLNRFKEAVHLCDWNPVFDALDPNLSYNVSLINSNNCTTLIFLLNTIKERHINHARKPWITPALVKSILQKISINRKSIPKQIE
jgi:hypothetical protein